MKRYFRTTFPLSAVAIFLAGCTNPAQFDDRNSYEKTKQGALIGGVLGAMGLVIAGQELLRHGQDRLKLASD